MVTLFALPCNTPYESTEIANEANSSEYSVHEYAEPVMYKVEEPARVRIVAIDPGHQGRGNYTREPNGPGSTVYKAKVSTGTRGVVTGVPEFELVLVISLMLRDELVARGYEVFLTRECHDVDISNAQRAIIASEAEADVLIRVHANGSSNPDVHGTMTISHTKNNPYIPELYQDSRDLSDLMLQEMLATTGARSAGVWETDTMTGTNWATMPVTIIEMGFMTNPTEDRLMQTPEYQRKLVKGMANGLDLFFASRMENNEAE
jgi:N-acetylmuramoyl-L-alanine amidase